MKALAVVASHSLRDPRASNSAMFVLELRLGSASRYSPETICSLSQIGLALGFGTASYSNARPLVSLPQYDSWKLIQIGQRALDEAQG